jgi:hypothetical protein
VLVAYCDTDVLVAYCDSDALVAYCDSDVLAVLHYGEHLRPPAPTVPCFKILSWNVAGLRAVLKKVRSSVLFLLLSFYPSWPSWSEIPP